MQKYSRRVGFIIGNIGGLIGAGFSILGVIENHFYHYLLAGILPVSFGYLILICTTNLLPHTNEELYHSTVFLYSKGVIVSSVVNRYHYEYISLR